MYKVASKHCRCEQVRALHGIVSRILPSCRKKKRLRHLVIGLTNRALLFKKRLGWAEFYSRTLPQIQVSVNTHAIIHCSLPSSFLGLTGNTNLTEVTFSATFDQGNWGLHPSLRWQQHTEPPKHPQHTSVLDKSWKIILHAHYYLKAQERGSALSYSLTADEVCAQTAVHIPAIRALLEQPG